MSVRRNYGENDKLETIGIRTFYKFMVRNSFYKNQDTFSQKNLLVVLSFTFFRFFKILVLVDVVEVRSFRLGFAYAGRLVLSVDGFR